MVKDTVSAINFCPGLTEQEAAGSHKDQDQSVRHEVVYAKRWYQWDVGDATTGREYRQRLFNTERWSRVN